MASVKPGLQKRRLQTAAGGSGGTGGAPCSAGGTIRADQVDSQTCHHQVHRMRVPSLSLGTPEPANLGNRRHALSRRRRPRLLRAVAAAKVGPWGASAPLETGGQPSRNDQNQLHLARRKSIGQGVKVL